MLHKIAVAFACTLFATNTMGQTAARIVLDQHDAAHRFYIAYPPATGKPKLPLQDTVWREMNGFWTGFTVIKD